MKKTVYALSAFLLFMTIVVGVNKYDPYLRTDVFRSFAKGNWHITSEEDTLYTIGYYGVRKYLASDMKNMGLLAENDEFCVDRIIGRSGCVHGDYLYVTARSFLPGPVKSKGKNGGLLVLKKSDLSIVHELDYDIKLVDAKTFGNILVVSGLKGFNIYDIGNPRIPKSVFSYRHPKYREYQGFDFFENEGKVYVAFSLFAEGLEIWDITHPERATTICHIPIKEKVANELELMEGQSMDIITNYPYLYATLGPSTKTFNTDKDKRGVLVYDISNIDSIKKNVALVPKSDWYSKKTGDRQPTYITRYHNMLYVNFAENGVAMFDISDPSHPHYNGTVDISTEKALIQPIHATEKGKLFAGDYYWKTIYGVEISDKLKTKN